MAITTSIVTAQVVDAAITEAIYAPDTPGADGVKSVGQKLITISL